MTKRRNVTIILVCVCCAVMGVVDAVIKPGYLIKSIIKLALFMLIPFICSRIYCDLNLKTLFKPSKKGILIALLAGIAVYGVILCGYFLFGGFFDLSGIVNSLTSDVGVTRENFLYVAIYISFINSLLEEFFFRGFSFLKLSEVTSSKFACVFSALAFAIYHISMMIGWFGFPLMLLTMTALFAAGMIFNFFNSRFGNIYVSWLIHIFANFAINTIGFILFGKI